MRLHHVLNEQYGSNNSALLRYLLNRADIDWMMALDSGYIDDYIENHDHEIPIEKQVEFGEFRNKENPKQIERWFKDVGHLEGFLEYFAERMLSDDPSYAPSWAYLMANERLVPRNEWLIHYSDDADLIARNGFKYGVDDMDRIGLTRWFKDSTRKSYKGFNFAFHANDRRAFYNTSKYGKDAVLFQSSGVSAWHHGDEEQQVIFWGEYVKPRDIVLIKNNIDDYEWAVMAKKPPRDGREYVYAADNLQDCVKWVQKHWRQYQRVIMG